MKASFHFSRMGGTVFSFLVVRVLLAGVLLTAAILKTLDPAPHSSSWFALPLVLVELFLATWLIFGLLPRYSWGAATLCFSSFAGISAIQIHSGETDCGCFGVVDTSPWVALGIDGIALLLLLASSQVVRSSDSSLTSRTVLCAIASYGVAVLLAVGAMSGVIGNKRNEAPGLSTAGAQMFVDATQWLNRPFPLLRYLKLQPDTDVTSGDWVIVFYRANCSACETLLERMSREGPGCLGACDDQILLVSVPSDRSVATSQREQPYRTAALQGKRKWVMTTPLVVRVSDATVVEVVPAAMQRGSGTSLNPVRMRPPRVVDR